MTKGIIYLIQPGELKGTNRYKIGASANETIARIKNGYSSDTKIILVLNCTKPFLLEKNIKKIFNKKFTLISGKEYFKGNEKMMIDVITKLYIKHNQNNYGDDNDIDNDDNNDIDNDDGNDIDNETNDKNDDDNDINNDDDNDDVNETNDENYDIDALLKQNFNIKILQKLAKKTKTNPEFYEISDQYLKNYFFTISNDTFYRKLSTNEINIFSNNNLKKSILNKKILGFKWNSNKNRIIKNVDFIDKLINYDSFDTIVVELDKPVCFEKDNIKYVNLYAQIEIKPSNKDLINYDIITVKELFNFFLNIFQHYSFCLIENFQIVNNTIMCLSIGAKQNFALNIGLGENKFCNLIETIIGKLSTFKTEIVNDIVERNDINIIGKHLIVLTNLPSLNTWQLKILLNKLNDVILLKKIQINKPHVCANNISNLLLRSNTILDNPSIINLPNINFDINDNKDFIDILLTYSKINHNVNMNGNFIKISNADYLLDNFITHVFESKNLQFIDYGTFYTKFLEFSKLPGIDMHKFNTKYIKFTNCLKRKTNKKIKLNNITITNDMILKRYLVDDNLPHHQKFVKECFYLKGILIKTKSKLFHQNYCTFMKILYPEEKILGVRTFLNNVRKDFSNHLTLPTRENNYIIQSNHKLLKKFFKNKLSLFDFVTDEIQFHKMNKSKKSKLDDE